VLLAVAVTLATPDALVMAVVPDSVALAPLEGAAKVTVTPLSGIPPESFTVAASAAPKAAPITADCGVPPVAVTLAAAVDVLVRLNVAESPPAEAVTL